MKMDSIESPILAVITSIRDFVWGAPTIVLLVGTGIFLTFRLRGLQLRGLLNSPYLGLIKRKQDNKEADDISHFQALMTAPAATVGTENITGLVATIVAGGPGALFWMSIISF